MWWPLVQNARRACHTAALAGRPSTGRRQINSLTFSSIAVLSSDLCLLCFLCLLTLTLCPACYAIPATSLAQANRQTVYFTPTTPTKCGRNEPRRTASSCLSTPCPLASDNPTKCSVRTYSCIYIYTRELTRNLTVDSHMCTEAISHKIELLKQLGVVLQGAIKPSESPVPSSLQE